jgi:hypothetical protein|tara:strand:- start:40 stop:198 length:159 start_codon:yes stop_codon:yes gene_type:complete
MNIEGTGMKFLKIIWETIKRLILMIGLMMAIVLWCVVIFIMSIYDAIFGGWK